MVRGQKDANGAKARLLDREDNLGKGAGEQVKRNNPMLQPDNLGGERREKRRKNINLVEEGGGVVRTGRT